MKMKMRTTMRTMETTAEAGRFLEGNGKSRAEQNRTERREASDCGFDREISLKTLAEEEEQEI